LKHALLYLIALLMLLLLSACQSQPSVCPQVTGTPGYLTIPPEELAAPLSAASPTQVEVNGRTIQVDKVVEGPLCNDAWSGTVYVTCNVQVYPWEESPTFLKDCSLSIAPGTVVYVAYHNNTAYYNGCSCHTGEIAGP
jgi:hypothetical protein